MIKTDEPLLRVARFFMRHSMLHVPHWICMEFTSCLANRVPVVISNLRYDPYRASPQLPEN